MTGKTLNHVPRSGCGARVVHVIHSLTGIAVRREVQRAVENGGRWCAEREVDRLPVTPLIVKDAQQAPYQVAEMPALELTVTVVVVLA
jgi:hypothetical protein